MAEDDLTALPAPDDNSEEKKPGLMGFILALLAVTLIGGGGGAMMASVQFDQINAVVVKRANTEPLKTENALAWDEETAISRLEPIVTNIAEPAGAWLRLDTAMVFDREAVDDVERMKAELSQAILQFLRTVSISELQGASAFNHLRDDLNERARMSSSGTVKELIVETMVVQ